MPSRKDLANAIRVLSMDAVQKANSGHPGMPMGMADIAEVLWNDYLSHNPNNPDWPNRDRFVLSNGHGCMLQYSLLHLAGYDLSMDDIKDFRQLHSKTPGHPEKADTPGVETTTGPLGQGFANAVGMAIAEKHLAKTFNRDELTVIDHYAYVFMGDGCMMEGVSHEAASLAGTLGLGKLIAFWDDNHISIDGDTDGWFSDDTPARFRAYHWHVITDVDGHDADAIKQAIEDARAETEKPTLICCRTTIGYGAPTKQGKASTHGAPLGDDEISGARKKLGWSHAPFDIPADIYESFDARTKGEAREDAWKQLIKAYEAAHPKLAKELMRRLEGRLPDNWEQESEHNIATAQQLEKAMATRKASGNSLEHFGPLLPELIGGSADLTGSNNTWWSGSKVLTKDNPGGNYIHYGVREFGMFAIMNGMAVHGGVRPYGGTFLVFADYGRNAIRLASIMKVPTIFVLTHDSIGLGEDGPTHQPIEHAAMLRATPGVMVWRPADLAETAVAWQFALQQQGPTCLLLTRQNVPGLAREPEQLEAVSQGGYILKDTDGKPDAIIMATGSEVHLALEAAETLSETCKVRVVSMPCTKRFDAQPESYRETVLPSNVTARVSVEAGSKGCWYKYVGSQGVVIGLDEFGLSAPYKEIYEDKGITVSAIADAVKSVVKMPVDVE